MSQKILRTGIIVIVILPFLAAILVSVAKAASPDLSQPISVSWTQQPKAFYAYGEKLEYRLTITSTSDQIHYVSVHAEAYEEPTKLFQPNSITRTYKILPGQTIKFLFQAYAPSGAVFDNPEFMMDASIEAEGYPAQSIATVTWHDSGK